MIQRFDAIPWLCALGLWIIGGLAMSSTQLNAADGAATTLETSERHQEWVDITVPDGQPVRAYVIFPEVSKPAPSVIVIHENRGLTDWVRSIGDKLAEHGYLAICPDLLYGTGPDGGGTDSFASSDDARTAIYELDPDHVTAALKATAAYARGLPSTTEKVAVVGYCWGGAQSFRLATNEPALTAAFVFYGSPPAKESMTRIACPVYGFYGENDSRINATIEDTEHAMKAAGKVYEPVIYPGVGHAFLRRGMTDEATDIERDSTQKAWERLLQLLERHQKNS